MVTFAPVGLPGGDRIAEGIAAWVDSAAMAALLADGGHDPLPDAPLGERLAALAAVAEQWDSRNGRERSEVVGADVPPERAELIRAAAFALGLGGRQVPPGRRYDHVLVHGGGVATMMARAGHAAAVLTGGVEAATVTGLGSLRELTIQVEGMPACETEGDAVDLGLRRAFDLDGPPEIREGVNAIGKPWWVRSYAGVRPVVRVLAAPGTRPGMRANTADTLTGWAELVQPEPKGTRLLAVTTDIFVPFQHCDAVRLLGLRYGCTVDTIGFGTAANRWVATPKPYQLLQEIRSAVLSMRALQQALG